MLEIASEIIICLLLAALIGFAIGYLFATSLSKRSPIETKDTEHPIEEKNTHDTETPDIETRATEEMPIVEPQEEPLEETLTEVEEETQTSEEVEIPTENAIEQALEALEAFETPETDIQEEETSEQKPVLLSEPRNGVKDELTKIKGIGPKVEEKLNAAGIYHFDQIAHWTDANMLWLETHTLFVSRVKKEAWREESKSFLN